MRFVFYIVSFLSLFLFCSGISKLKTTFVVADKKTSELEIPLVIVSVKDANTFVDVRDNQVYRRVKIGNKIWMAQNLNYGKLVLNLEQTNNTVNEKSYYNNDSTLSNEFGALYTWEEASAYEKPNNKGLLKGLCPDGWHLPSDKEWSELCTSLDAEVDKNITGWSGKNIALLLVDSFGTNIRFNLKMAGNGVSHWFFYKHQMAYFWTATEYSNASAWYRSFDKNTSRVYRGPGDIKLGMSIRCVKD